MCCELCFGSFELVISNGFRLEGKGLAAEFLNRRHGAATHANGEFQTPRVRRTVWLLVEHSVRVAQASFLEDYRICHWPGFMKCKAFCGPSMTRPMKLHSIWGLQVVNNLLLKSDLIPDISGQPFLGGDTDYRFQLQARGLGERDRQEVLGGPGGQASLSWHS